MVSFTKPLVLMLMATVSNRESGVCVLIFRIVVTYSCMDLEMTIDEACDKVIAEHPQSVQAYKKGGPFLGFLVGRVMSIDRSFNPASVQRILRQKINK